ncbi:hypothetical protein H8D79_00620 [PVC group bacterium]|nr:hypothetical protein [PVC group bacterium]
MPGIPHPTEYRWSSARAHVDGRDDALVKVQALLDRFGDWQAFLASGLSDEAAEQLRSHERTGRPLGAPAFEERLEGLLCRVLKPHKRGPKPRTKRANARRTSKSDG